MLRKLIGKELQGVFTANSPERLAIVADDLTGACDAAAAFANRGIPTEVDLAPRFNPSRATVAAICTATRDVPESIAAEAMQALAVDYRLAGFPRLFKKVDSVFRGNTFVEIAAAARAFPGRFAVIAPASPRHGRTCRDATLHIEDLSGRRVTALRAALEEQGLVPRWLAAGPGLAAEIQSAYRQSARAVFCDSTCDEDLTRIVAAAHSLPTPILWIGSSGLAHALAATMPQRTATAAILNPGQVLLLTGSDHPVSAAQLAHLQQQPGLPVTVIRIERSQTTDGEIRFATQHLSAESLSCMILNGGDTALQVCRALGMDSLELGSEFAPGVAQAVACGGRFDGATVILKSGGFGTSDLFTQIARLAHQECPA